MATPTGFSHPSLSISRDGIRLCRQALQVFLVLSPLLAIISSASAQSPIQQYVYGSGSLSPTSSVVSGFSKASQSGALSILAGSPFNERLEGGLVAIDGQGKFLFVLNPKSNDISMFQIDPTSGALSEVPASPFQVPASLPPNPAPSQPISIATEKSGKFVFVGYYMGDIVGSSAIVTLSIDISGPSPVLVTEHSIETNSGGAPAQLFADPKGIRLYVGLTHGQNNLEIGGAEVYSIDPTSGTLGYLGLADSPPAEGRSVALDPLDRFFYVGWGGNIGAVDTCVLSPVDGTALVPSSSVQLGLGNFPDSLIAENSGKFLYVTSPSGTIIYTIDQTTGALTSAPGPISAIPFSQGSSVADPMGPFIYSLSALGIHVFQIDQQSGSLAEIPGSPFNAGMNGVVSVSGLAISGTPIQAVSGPAATLFPSNADFGSVTVGSTSGTRMFSIVNVGGQNLSINSISITGPNASSFPESNTCASTLAPNANCTVSINFMPSGPGTFSATVQVADNAPGSPQTSTLNGTGVAPTPAISFSPAAPSFPTITQGTSGMAQTLMVISSGTAPLHVSSVSLSGPNSSDFSITNNSCTAPVAPSANCTISVAFNPIAPGIRAANLLIADDASGSPQTISLNATANPAFTFGPAPNGSTTETVSAGQTAQFLLQLTPGSGYSGSVSMSCSGAPFGAMCQVPTSVPIANGAPAPFTVSVSTSGGALLHPWSPRRFVHPDSLGVLLLLALALISVRAMKNRWMLDGKVSVRRLAWSGVVTAILFCSVIFAIGCGSSGSTFSATSPPPPPPATPAGTFTIMVTPAAMSSTGQPLQLTPIQLTLIVK